jgi:serine/threonine protein kinase
MSVPPTQITFIAPEIKELAPLFPGYDFEILIATGGMGAVYRAVQKSLERTVAIKILPQEFTKDEAFCAGFEAEAKAMARLNHPNLIGVYDFGEVRGMLYIIMEYVPGKSLFHSSHGKAIDPIEVIRLLTGVCNGLAHAHENGILHRDIKPSNILLDLNAEPKIGDFGLARPIERKVEDGEEIFGTPHYTAPEVVHSPNSVDYRADIFSVGVMLHELLTGSLPADDPRPASAIAHCDPRFDVIIRKATNPLPAARYASASEITSDLNAIAISAGPRVLRTAAVPAPASRRSHPTTARPLASTSSSSAPVIGILVAAVVVVGLILLILANRNSQPPPVNQASPTPASPVVPPPVNPNPVRPEPKKDREPVSNWKPAPVPEPGPDDVDTPEPLEKPDIDPEPPDTEKSGNDTAVSGDPDTSDPAQPEFDLEEFLTRARRIMQERSAPLITSRDEGFVKNLAEYERGLKRIVRRLDSKEAKTKAEERVDEYMEDCRSKGSRIPKDILATFTIDDDLKGLHEESLEKQETLDSVLKLELTKLAPIYVLGLEKQIERLDPKIEEEAISAIKTEIESTRLKSSYFPNLMLGLPTDTDEDDESPTDIEDNDDDGF